MENARFSWVLGFLASDGSLVYPTYRSKGDESHISFCLHHKDSEVLYKIKEILCTRGTVKLYPQYKSPQCQLNIYDRKDIQMKYHNIKSTVPTDVNPRHYIRGLVDGDGCLNYRIERKSFRINVINEFVDIVEYVSRKVSETFDVAYKIPKYKEQDHLYIVEWEGKIARLIAWWLYHGDIKDCVLERKLKLYKQYILHNNDFSNVADELFMGIGLGGQYLIQNRQDGILIHMQTNSIDSLRWTKILSKIIKRSTPIPVTKGQTKYYALYIPVTDMQSIQMDEDIVQ